MVSDRPELAKEMAKLLRDHPKLVDLTRDTNEKEKEKSMQFSVKLSEHHKEDKQKEVNDNKFPYKCPICDKQEKNKALMQLHKENTHADQKRVPYEEWIFSSSVRIK